jgi:hypothetical protein
MQSIQEYHLPHGEANLVCYTYYNPFFVYLFILCSKSIMMLRVNGYSRNVDESANFWVP